MQTLKAPPLLSLEFLLSHSLRLAGAWGRYWEQGHIYTSRRRSNTVLMVGRAAYASPDSFKKWSHGTPIKFASLLGTQSRSFCPTKGYLPKILATSPMPAGTERPQSTGCLGL